MRSTRNTYLVRSLGRLEVGLILGPVLGHVLLERHARHLPGLEIDIVADDRVRQRQRIICEMFGSTSIGEYPCRLSPYGTRCLKHQRRIRTVDHHTIAQGELIEMDFCGLALVGGACEHLLEAQAQLHPQLGHSHGAGCLERASAILRAQEGCVRNGYEGLHKFARIEGFPYIFVLRSMCMEGTVFGRGVPCPRTTSQHSHNMFQAAQKAQCVVQGALLLRCREQLG